MAVNAIMADAMNYRSKVLGKKGGGEGGVHGLPKKEHLVKAWAG
jgi:hypothetical protein